MDFDWQAIQAWIAAWGVVAPAVYMCLYALAMLLCIPGTPFVLISGLLFGPLWGGIYSIAGAVCGATIAFSIARTFGAGWVEKNILQRHPKIATLVTTSSKQGWHTVALLRIVPVFPFPLINYALGLTRVHWKDFVWATAVFMAPSVFVYTYVGSLGQAFYEQEGQALLWKGSIALMLLIILASIPWVHHYLSKKKKTS